MSNGIRRLTVSPGPACSDAERNMSRIPSDRGEEGRCPDFEERVLKLCACHPVLGLPVYLLYAPGTAPYGRSTPTGGSQNAISSPSAFS
jgi:hypothetical protein